jgi:CheY-like chemotaxis protein
MEQEWNISRCTTGRISSSLTSHFGIREILRCPLAVLSTCEQIPVHMFLHYSRMNPQTVRSQASHSDALILCVDDDDAILDIIRLTLQKNGFSVISANNWRSALEAFKNNHIDLVMLDYEMPGMKGHEVAIQLRTVNPAVPIILHSGSSNIPDVARRVVDAFLPKGVETYILVAAISSLIMKNRVGDVSRPAVGFPRSNHKAATHHFSQPRRGND